MATTPKKPTAKKKAPAAKKAAPKKTAAKKPAAKKTAVKKVDAAPAKQQASRTDSKSFRITRSTVPFMTFRVTRETAYWAVLGVVVILFTAWILHLQSEIANIYDQIEISTALSDNADAQLRLKQSK